jgi:hypothetical protein
MLNLQKMQIKMKKVFLLISGFALLNGLTASKAIAQASITATATAQVLAVLTATETAQLNFGRFSPETQGGKIILTPEGVRTAEGTVVLGGGAANSASFYITGEYESTFTITLPSGPATLTNVLNARTMQVSDWQSYPAPGIGVGKLTGGAMTVQVGAVLNVGNMLANPVGIYTGIYSITFAYN